MGLGRWLKKKVGAIALATGSVEKAALGQDGGTELGANSSQHQRHRQGSLADALQQGEVTQEVQELRWRMYKVLEESKKYKTTVVGYDENGNMITEQTNIDGGKGSLGKVNMDDTDYSKTDEAKNNGYEYYPLELVVNNDVDTKSVDVMFGEVDSGRSKAVDSRITCIREAPVRFEIEKFTKKMNVRTINNTEKLLEFYTSIYPNEDNRKSYLFISQIKKAIVNPRVADFLDIVSVDFVSYNTVGVKDLHSFNYKITKFDKIVEYDGHYVIKFKADVIVNGESLYEQFRDEELDKRYENKEKKDQL